MPKLKFIIRRYPEWVFTVVFILRLLKSCHYERLQLDFHTHMELTSQSDSRLWPPKETLPVN